MTTISGLEQQNGQPPGSEIQRPVIVGCRRNWSTLGTLAIAGILLACGAPHVSASASVALASNRQAILVTSTNQAAPSQFTLQSLPTESAIAPGLFFRPQRFDQVRLSPDGRYAAFSTSGHHTLVGVLDLASMAVREIGVITEGEVMVFHWAADSRTLVYDYLPASGYRRVKGYDMKSGERLVVSRIDGKSAVHIMFEDWGSRQHEVILRVTDGCSNERRTETATLISLR